jgi:hypothetical protein
MVPRLRRPQTPPADRAGGAASPLRTLIGGAARTLDVFATGATAAIALVAAVLQIAAEFAF